MIKKSYVLIVGMLMLLSTIFVSASINDNELTSGPVHNIDKNTYYSTIRAGVLDADPGNTIEVAAGTYNDPIVFGNWLYNITLIGEDKNTTIIEANPSYGFCIYNIPDWSNVSGFTIRGAIDHSYRSGIYSTASFCHFFDNRFEDNDIGILIDNGHNNTIANNEFISNTFRGINLRNSNYNIIEHNQCIDTHCMGMGILLTYSHHNHIRYNYCSSNTSYQTHGIHLGGSQMNIIENNTCTNHLYSGIDIVFSSNNNIVMNNYFAFNSRYGLLIESSNNNTFSGNLIEKNDIGVLLYRSSTNYPHSSDNILYHNNFIENNPNGSQVFDNGINNTWYHDSLLEGNYWSNYSGLDDGSGTGKHAIAGDGIGDSLIPHPTAGFDHYPFTELNGWKEVNNSTATATGPQGAHHDPIITITYDWTETPIAVDLYYSMNVGDSWNYLGTDTSVDGYYDWAPGANPGPKPSKYYWIANAQNGTDDVGVPANGSAPEAGPFNWKTWDVCQSTSKTFSVSDDNWHFISVPLVINDDVLTVFDDARWGDGGTTWDVIQWYDASESRWKSYSIYRPSALNDMPNINNVMGVWIHLTSNGGDGALTTGAGIAPASTTITLHAGWNLVGYPTLNDTEIVANALWGTGADKVEVFDPAEPYRIREVGATYVMKPGEGYWIHVPADSVWIVNW